MISSARMIDELNHLDDNFFDNKKARGFSNTSSIHEQIMLWHLRLRHPKFLYLNHLFLELFKKLNCLSFQCESCHLLKNQHAIYSSKPIYLIHRDAWVPSKITIVSRKKIFVTFIDDHTR